MECVVPAILCSAFMDVAVAPEVGIDSLSSLVNFKKEGGGELPLRSPTMKVV